MVSFFYPNFSSFSILKAAIILEVSYVKYTRPSYLLVERHLVLCTYTLLWSSETISICETTPLSSNEKHEHHNATSVNDTEKLGIMQSHPVPGNEIQNERDQPQLVKVKHPGGKAKPPPWVIEEKQNWMKATPVSTVLCKAIQRNGLTTPIKT